MGLFETVIVIVVIVNLLISIGLFFALRNKSSAREEQLSFEKIAAELKADLISKQTENILNLRQSLDTANKMINDRLAEGNETLDRKMAVVGQIEHKLGELYSQTGEIRKIGENIQSLSDLLKPPKIRGMMGEIFLENLLRQILPPDLISLQHKYKDGQRVDAAVKLGDFFMPIDSKFPLESFQRLLNLHENDDQYKAALTEFKRAVKKHIEDISTKYIRPNEGSADFALMYLPSEALFARFVSDENNDGFEQALSKKVIPTSPGHIYGFLTSIAAVYRQSGLSSEGRQLIENLNRMSLSVDNLNRYHERLQSSLNSAQQVNEKATKELSQLEGSLKALLEGRSSGNEEKNQETS